jgi:hypothetical protein
MVQLFLALKIGFHRSISAPLLRAVKARAGACFLLTRTGGVARLVGSVLCVRLFVRYYFRPLFICASHWWPGDLRLLWLRRTVRYMHLGTSECTRLVVLVRCVLALLRQCLMRSLLLFRV